MFKYNALKIYLTDEPKATCHHVHLFQFLTPYTELFQQYLMRQIPESCSDACVQLEKFSS